MKWNKKGKRLSAFLLALCMVLSGSCLYTDAKEEETDDVIYIANPGAPYPIPEKTCSWVTDDPDVVHSGACVEWIQLFLLQYYLETSNGPFNILGHEYEREGIYDNDTTILVKMYQHDVGLPENGVTDAATRESILAYWRKLRQEQIKTDYTDPTIEQFVIDVRKQDDKGFQVYLVVDDNRGVKRVVIEIWSDEEGEAGKKETVYEADIPGNTITHTEAWSDHHDQKGTYEIRVTVEDYAHRHQTVQKSTVRQDSATEATTISGIPTTEEVTTTETPTTEKVTTTEAPTTEKVTTTQAPTTEMVTTTQVTTVEKVTPIQASTTEKTATTGNSQTTEQVIKVQENTTAATTEYAQTATTQKTNASKKQPQAKKKATLKRPTIRVYKKRAGKNIRYLQIQLKQYQGDMVDIYLKKQKGSYQKLKLKNNSIKKLKKKVNLQYTLKKQTIWLKVRTYKKKGKQTIYSSYSKTVRIRW